MGSPLATEEEVRARLLHVETELEQLRGQNRRLRGIIDGVMLVHKLTADLLANEDKYPGNPGDK